MTSAITFGDSKAIRFERRDGGDVVERFRAFVRSDRFPCVGARSTLNSGGETICVYEKLATDAATRALAHDLGGFHRRGTRSHFRSFVAIFRAPQIRGEQHFEDLLWRQLQLLHDADTTAGWAPGVASDPADSDFCFSFARRPYFVVGMHPRASRLSRRFETPVLVFNPHEQFQQLRGGGTMRRMQEVIRARELRLQGSLNPMLSDFGEAPGSRQYSGRAVDDDWRCPFRSRVA